MEANVAASQERYFSESADGIQIAQSVSGSMIAKFRSVSKLLLPYLFTDKQDAFQVPTSFPLPPPMVLRCAEADCGERGINCLLTHLTRTYVYFRCSNFSGPLGPPASRMRGESHSNMGSLVGFALQLWRPPRPRVCPFSSPPPLSRALAISTHFRIWGKRQRTLYNPKLKEASHSKTFRV